jgi:hypothetical protein
MRQLLIYFANVSAYFYAVLVWSASFFKIISHYSVDVLAPFGIS